MLTETIDRLVLGCCDFQQFSKIPYVKGQVMLITSWLKSLNTKRQMSRKSARVVRRETSNPVSAAVELLEDRTLLAATSRGVIEFDMVDYEVGESVAVTVSDIDLIGTGSVVVNVTTTAGDAESVTLGEVGMGLFRGTIATSGDPIATGDSTLQVQVGDVLSGSYTDADIGGTPAPRRLFATSIGDGIVEISPFTGATIRQFATPISAGVGDGLAFDGTRLWYISGSFQSNLLFEMDPDTGNVIDTHFIPGGATFPEGLAALDGLIYLMDSTNDEIIVFDPFTDAVVNRLDIDAINGGQNIGGGFSAITTGGKSLIAGTNTDEIVFINPTTGVVEGSFTYLGGGGDLGIAAVNGQIYVGNNTGLTDQIRVYNRSGSEIAQLTVSGSIGVQSLGGDDARILLQSRLFAAGFQAAGAVNVLLELDPADGTVLSRSLLPDQVNSTDEGMAYDGRDLWFLSSGGTKMLYRFDPDTGAIVDTIPLAGVVPANAILDGIAALNGGIYIQNRQSSDIYVFSPVTRTIVNTLNVDAVNGNVQISGGLSGIRNSDGLISGRAEDGVVYEINPSNGFIVRSFNHDLTTVHGTAVSNGEIFLSGSKIEPISVYSRFGTLRRSLPFPAGIENIGGLAGDDVLVATSGTQVARNIAAIVAPLTMQFDTTSVAENTGAAAVTATLTRGGDLVGDLVVTLFSSDTTEVTVPLTVTILDGEATATFDLDILDDNFLDGTQSVSISASALGHAAAESILDVLDYEPLTVTVNPTSISENGGIRASVGTVTRSDIDGPFLPLPSSVGSTEVPRSLPDQSTVTSRLFFNGFGGLIGDVNVSFNITHTFVGDLELTLVSPQGTRVQLINHVGGGGNDFRNTVLDDEAPTPITTGTAPFVGRYKPSSLLSAFDGENANGTWTLEVSDTVGGDSGSLNAWSLEITTLILPPVEIILASNDSSELSIPASVVIPIGQMSTTFNINAVDDNIHDGPQTVSITAQAAGYVDGSSAITVNDHETMSLTLSSSFVAENAGAGALTGTLTRNNSDLGLPLVVSLASDDTSEITVPATVTIPAGQATTTFSVDAIDDDILDGLQSVRITASAPDYVDTITTVNVSDHETLSLQVTDPSITEDAGAAATTGTVSRSNTDVSQPLVVTLTNGNPNEISIPLTVTIPAGMSSVSFDIDAVNDALVDGIQTVSITASSAGYFSGSGNVHVTNVTMPQITFTFDATEISENAGQMATRGTVSHNIVNHGLPVVVTLLNPDPSEISLPSGVTIAAFENSATFDVAAVDDDLFDGTQTVTVTATVNGFLPGSATINVLDFEPLLIELSASSIAENAGASAAFGTVSRSSMNLVGDLEVTLINGDITEISIPPLVVIPDGFESVTFPIDGVDDNLLDGTQTVNITALANSFAAGRATLNVTDYETLTLTLNRSEVSESAGPNAATGVITRSNTDITSALVVTLTNSDPSEVSVPPTVIIPANQATGTFSITAINDGLLDGNQTLQISSVASGYVGSSRPLTVVDTTSPRALTPAGVSEITNPTFRWTDVIGAVRYDLWVNNLTTGQTQVIRDQNIQTTSYVASGLNPGDSYIWAVRAFNAVGSVSQFSPFQTFTVIAAPENLTATNVMVGTTPTVSWSPVPGADHYDVWINNLTTGQNSVIRAQNVNGTSLALLSGISAGESYLWAVRAIASDGSPGNWSDASVFSMVGTPTPIGPTSLTNDPQPTFQWTVASGANRYDLWVNNITTGQSQIIRRSNLTTTTFRAFTGITEGDSYAWAVRSFTSDGFSSPWSTPRYFTTVGTPTIVSPTTTTITTKPTFTWTATPGASGYDVWVNDLTTGESQVVRNRNVTGTSYATPDSLVVGHSYLWTVRAITAEGFFGEWAPADDFTIIEPLSATPPTLLAPINFVFTSTPTFTWTTVTGASEYEIYMIDATTSANSVVLSTTVTGTQYVATTPLQSGRTYRWWVRAINDVGQFGRWGASQQFSVAALDSASDGSNAQPITDEDASDAGMTSESPVRVEDHELLAVRDEGVSRQLSDHQAVALPVSADNLLPEPDARLQAASIATVAHTTGNTSGSVTSAPQSAPLMTASEVDRGIDTIMADWNETEWWAGTTVEVESADELSTPAIADAKPAIAGALAAVAVPLLARRVRRDRQRHDSKE